MGRMKAMIKQVRGRKKEADGIALRNERLRAEGEREKQRGREERQPHHSSNDPAA